MEFLCVECSDPLAATDRFCETCGTEQPPPGATTSQPPTAARRCDDCGAAPGAIDPDGYCGECGKRAAPPRDHMVLVRAGIVGATDRGRVHAHNEDAMALARSSSGDGGWVGIVADGVSTSQHAEVAAQVAVDAACTALTPAVDDPTIAIDEAFDEAVAAALAAVRAVPWDTDRRDLGAPACTLAIALWRPGEPLSVLSIGDTRCYWLGAEGTNLCLTSDDSWAAEQLADGVDRELVEADHLAHAITRWLGVDAPPIESSAVPFDAIAAGGRVLVCSDGLWNYASDPDDLRSQLDDAPHGIDDESDGLVASAERALRFANDRGGHDNITAVLAAIPASGEG